jgi:FlaA1/EpsC-like NDP-sugar epimerase
MQPQSSLFKSLLWHYAHLRNRHILLLDVALFAIAPLLALALRMDGFQGVGAYTSTLILYTFISLVVHTLIFGSFRLYSRFWRYATVEDVLPIVSASIVSMIVMGIVYSILYATNMVAQGMPHSLPILEGMLIFALASCSRFSLRLAMHFMRDPHYDNAENVLIIGAGETAQALARDLSTNTHLGMRPIGFLTDDVHRKGLRLMNRPVLGRFEDLPSVVVNQEVSKVVIAIPDAAGKTIRQIQDLCETADVPVKTVPRMTDIVEGKVNVSQLRNIELEDLLRREPIRTDTAAVRNSITGKRVLITGGGGSIGSELCRQILDARPSHIGLLGHGENTIFDIYNELQVRAAQASHPMDTDNKPIPPTTICAYIADIRFAQRVQNVVESFRPDIIFHAAAHKHVPLMEWNPGEAITNNVFGTRNLLDAAVACGVKNLVMISTDKAVNPTSVMGCSKRIAEQVVMDYARKTGNAYVAVRFGNVLGSRGSVVLTFKRQIAAGGPVTVSHQDMRRYFMTIPEAVQLVLQASVLGKGGEIFMLDMGDPVKIIDLARDLIELSGLEVGRDIDIVCTGVRPGEKLFEELFVPGESYQRTEHDKVILVQNASQFISPRLNTVIDAFEDAILNDDRAEIIQYMQDLVPEFAPDEVRLGIDVRSDKKVGAK